MTQQADTDLAERIEAGWNFDGSRIVKTFAFESFAAAFAFMGACVPEIEKRDHHPEWSNVYNKVTVALTTHDTGGITAKDHELARVMDRIFADQKTAH